MEEHKIKFATMVLKDGRLEETNIRFIKQDDVGKCPFFIMVPEHYREDGSCKCNDHEYRNKVMRKWGYSNRDFKKAGLILR